MLYILFNRFMATQFGQAVGNAFVGARHRLVAQAGEGAISFVGVCICGGIIVIVLIKAAVPLGDALVAGLTKTVNSVASFAPEETGP